MMSLRTRLFIIISLVILIILGISIFLTVRFGKKPVTTPATTDQSLPVGQETVVPTPESPSTPVVNTPAATPPVSASNPEEIEKNAAKQLAKVFIERYGTYSTDNGSENVLEIKSLVTPALWTTLSAKISNNIINPNQAPTAAFSGMSTQVFNTELSDWMQTSATITMQLIRTEEKNGAQIVKHQNAEVDMVKQNEQWLVQNFKWL